MWAARCVISKEMHSSFSEDYHRLTDTDTVFPRNYMEPGTMAYVVRVAFELDNVYKHRHYHSWQVVFHHEICQIS